MVTFPINLRTKTPTFAQISLGDEALAHYDEGTFTPALLLDTTNITSAASGAVNRGTYTRIGNVVYFNIESQVNRGTNTGTFRIRDLPFQSSATNFSVVNVGGEVGFRQSPPILAFIESSTTYIDFYLAPASTVAALSVMTQVNIAASSEVLIYVSGFYLV
jgi:hypothetical protein